MLFRSTGLQIKQAGLKSWAVPCKGYEHEWSGSIRALRTIKYLDKEETSKEILARNKKIFIDKWNRISEKNKKNGKETLLESYLLDIIKGQVNSLISDNKIDEAQQLLQLFINYCPDDLQILTSFGVVEYHKGNIDKAKEYFEKTLSIDPDYETAKENLEMILSEKEVKI